MKYIRNFCIIAHIDHGKTTLADRLIEICKGSFLKNSCVLDSMDLEIERGITIKSRCVTLFYIFNGERYTLNLIDTPGHIDFFSEVSHVVEACDGAILLIDSSQGVEAQTLGNYEIAKKNELIIIPVLNKIDLPYVDIKKCITQVLELDICKEEDILCVSGKTGFGIDVLLQTILKRVKQPRGDVNKQAECLIIDSLFEIYFGVVVTIVVRSGIIKEDDFLYINGNKVNKCKVINLGIFIPEKQKCTTLQAGEVGFLTLNIKDRFCLHVGDILYKEHNDVINFMLTKRQSLQYVIFSEIYSSEKNKYDYLRKSLIKLSFNDSFSFKQVSSKIFGLGFRCGYFGVLHMEIVVERLKREYNLSIINLPITITYKVFLYKKSFVFIDNPIDWPETRIIEKVYEQVFKVIIKTPVDYVGKIIDLCKRKRGSFFQIRGSVNATKYIDCNLPLQEIVHNFSTQLKSISRGFASFTYTFVNYVLTKVVKVIILINKEKFDNLSFLEHSDMVLERSVKFLDKVAIIIKKHLFTIKIQACVGLKIIKTKLIKASKKNVLDKCYGGDRTRKDKLLKKQKLGKKKLLKYSMKFKLTEKILCSIFS